MKRAFYLLSLAVFLAGLTAPLGVSLAGGSVRVLAHTSTAVADTNGPVNTTAPKASNAPKALPKCALDDKGKCPTGSAVDPDDCVKTALAILKNQGNCKGAPGVDNKSGGGAIVNYTRLILQLFSGLMGTVIVLILVLGGVQYITSIGDPARIKSAKKRITDAVLALVLFLMMFAIINFLVPGGLIS